MTYQIHINRDNEIIIESEGNQIGDILKINDSFRLSLYEDDQDHLRKWFETKASALAWLLSKKPDLVTSVLAIMEAYYSNW